MITYVNKDNATRYSLLYKKAYNALVEAKENDLAIVEDLESIEYIDTLEQYFHYLPYLMQLNGDGDIYYKTSGRRYAMLPLDEAHFKIHANERIIEVPTEFKKNGIAVKGDQVAEVVYFRVARYFDFMDLNSTDIFIQWQGTDEEGNPITGVSTEWVRDIESDPDYLIFGWALDSGTPDEPGVTRNSGTIKFSVRFITRNEQGEIDYSLNTLEATATVNKTLILEDDEYKAAAEKAEEINSMILNRVKSSLVVGADQADEPKFTTTLLDSAKAKEVDLINGEFSFAVHAYAPDAGKITYQWYIDGNLVETGADEEDFDYFPTTDTETQDGKIYYIETSDGVYEPDTTIDAETNKPDPNKHYERLCVYTAKTSGEYEVKAKNTVKLSSISVSGGKVLIPGPSIIQFERNGDNLVFENGNTELELDAKVIHLDKTDYAFEWIKNGEVKSTDEKFKITKSTQSGYDTSLQGDYYLKAIATKNKSSREGISNSFFVTFPPDEISEIVYTEKLANGEYVPSSGVHEVGDIIKAEPVFANGYQIDGRYSLSYAWYYQQGSNGTPKKIENAVSNELKIENAWVGCGIFCLITNNYNGRTSETSTQIIKKISVQYA